MEGDGWSLFKLIEEILNLATRCVLVCWAMAEFQRYCPSDLGLERHHPMEDVVILKYWLWSIYYPCGSSTSHAILQPLNVSAVNWCLHSWYSTL
jgi:hypothetical protein